LISFNFYIKFGPYFFNCYLFLFYPFSNWILFLISSLNIWFWFIFISNLGLSFFYYYPFCFFFNLFYFHFLRFQPSLFCDWEFYFIIF
jgi:hypothetical protein